MPNASARQISQIERRQAAEERRERDQQERAEQAAEFAAEHLDAGMPRSVSEAVFGLAWEHGHASGWPEIGNFYGEFAALANTAFRAGRDSGK